MAKKRFISIIVAIAAIGAVAVTSAVIKRNSNTILNQNVEALMSGEFNPIAMCDGHCRYKSGYICILKTNFGFDINCDDMVPWM